MHHEYLIIEIPPILWIILLEKKTINFFIIIIDYHEMLTIKFNNTLPFTM